MDLYTNEDSQELLQSLDKALPYIEYVLKNNKPVFEGERYLTSEELCSILKISRRTLQYYRDNGLLSFIQLPGKVLFRESDIRKVLEDRLRSAYDVGDYPL
ncbi:helix-turn-helix domain-containing protein [Parabacteroides merdae]|uniref:Helix-turn-helix domain-containing protein n=1 Tax=Parabacteroides merdae TaxID=46503 RepID=A0A7K1HEG8_9BACT|nr:helix-turn-helix domain-containing protein [Parabacteroides merdae]MTU29589.1 helix-turn-helix domain-containing protein [Parabacteroides merdae]RYS83822.1 DNA-binding protein [Parabacteroides merdae]